MLTASQKQKRISLFQDIWELYDERGASPKVLIEVYGLGNKMALYRGFELIGKWRIGTGRTPA